MGTPWIVSFHLEEDNRLMFLKAVLDRDNCISGTYDPNFTNIESLKDLAITLGFTKRE